MLDEKIKPRIVSREIDLDTAKYLQSKGFDSILSNIVAARLKNTSSSNIDKIVNTKLRNLDSPNSLADIKKATKRLHKAILNQEVIGIETDHDCDGQTSHAVIYWCLTHHFGHPKEKIRHYIGHRLKEGYGLSDKLTERIIEDEVKASLIITADNGSNDEKNILKLKQNHIDTIITDHHQISSSSFPVSAIACINPNREDCQYPDKAIAGCMVAWLVMAATRNFLIQEGYLLKSAPKLQDCLDFVAIGTIADCVSIASSYNNRTVVNFGLGLINKKSRVCWQAIAINDNQSINSEHLGFQVAPLLNSDGRLSSAMQAVKFLLSNELNIAIAELDKLKEQNTNRKEIQKSITNQAFIKIQNNQNIGNSSICILLENGHAGVHGISASRIKDHFGLPTIIFSLKHGDDSIITGSARSIDGFNIKNILDEINQHDSSLIIKYGGHQGAAGITMYRENFISFANLFAKKCSSALSSTQLGPVIMTDGVLPASYINLQFIDKISGIEPFGREFEQPIFENIAIVNNFQVLGNGLHAKLNLTIESKYFNAVWFNFRHKESSNPDIQINDKIKIAFQLKRNFYNFRNYLQIQIISLIKM